MGNGITYVVDVRAGDGDGGGTDTEREVGQVGIAVEDPATEEDRVLQNIAVSISQDQWQFVKK